MACSAASHQATVGEDGAREGSFLKDFLLGWLRAFDGCVNRTGGRKTKMFGNLQDFFFPYIPGSSP
jgi:hypothetical protein